MLAKNHGHWLQEEWWQHDSFDTMHLSTFSLCYQLKDAGAFVNT